MNTNTLNSDPITNVTKKQEKLNEIERFKSYLDESIKENTVIYTKQTNGSGNTDYIEVFVIVDEHNGNPDSAPYILNVTYNVALATGTSFRETRKAGGIAVGGGGTSKGLEIYLLIRHLLDQDNRQGRWKTL